MNSRRGFTLIELLVAITIIMILIGLGAAGAMTLVFRAKSLATTKRMDEAATAISAVGAARGGAAFDLTSRLGLDRTSAAAWKTVIDASYVDATVRAYAGTDSGNVASQLPAAGPSAFLAGENVGPWGRIPIGGSPLPTTASAITIRALGPALSFFYLLEAGVLPATTAAASYRDDRKTTRAWNDRWGNPIVVSWLLYQASTGTAATDARRAYGSNRILSLSLAAGGKRIGGATGNAMTLPTEVWNHALNVASAGDTSAAIWDQNSFATPPWRNVKVTRNAQGDAWLMAPIEVR